MEEENQQTNPTQPIEFSSNWLTRGGSLDDFISFETPISSIAGEGDESRGESQTLEHKSVVLEAPPSSDSPLCEITVSFQQKHEIRQVYVRSTARIFEIYYTTEPRSSNDYLCTVRCGIVAKEDASPGTGAEEAPSARLEGSVDQKDSPEQKTKTDNSSNSDEDGWVEIKAPGSGSLDNRTGSWANSVDKNNERSIQDFYEATAEISDSTPCISLTLRLLSLQTKGRVHIEEIYIFGEPVESTDSVDKVDPMNTSTGSSMMAMLVPTLLQLSRKGNLEKKEEGHVDLRQAPIPESDERITREEAHSSQPNQKKVDAQASPKNIPESSTTHSDKSEPGPSQAPAYTNHASASSSDRIERTLDQLVHRVVRLESFCLRFEENMLKPIGNIETRLERLEQQLEVLTTRSHSTRPFPCTRITAPDFSEISSSDSETNSHQDNEDVAKSLDTLSHKSGSNSPRSDRNDPLPETSSNNRAPDSVVDPPKVPGMIFTAPEFSCEEDDDDDGHSNGVEFACNHNFSSVEMSSSVNKKPLSIDGALAVALADFMSSASAQPPRKTVPWIVKGPDSQDENFGDSGNDSSVSPARRSCGLNADSDGCNETHNLINLESTSSSSSQGNEAQTVRPPPSIGSAEAVFRDPLQEEETDASGGDESVTQPITRRNGCVGCVEVVANDNMESTNDAFVVLKTPQTGAARAIDIFGDSSTEAVIKGCIFQDEGSRAMKDSTDALAPLNLHNSGEAVSANPENSKDEVEIILDGNFNSRVDFEHSVLDVKFSSHGNLNSGRSSLETLLGDATDAHDMNGGETYVGRNQETQGTAEDGLQVEIGNVIAAAVNNGISRTESETGIQDSSERGNVEMAIPAMLQQKVPQFRLYWEM